jgi:capsular exopolysaccharide synthesis family protein
MRSRSQSVKSFDHDGRITQVPYFVIESNGTANGNEQIEFRDYVEGVLRHKLIVAIVTILLMIVPAYFILNAPLFYQAEAKIQVDSEEKARTDRMKASATTFDNRAYFNTQLKLLKNPTLIRRIIIDNQLENDKAFLDEKFIELDPAFAKRPWEGLSVDSDSDSDSGVNTTGVGDVSPARAEKLQPIVEAIQDALSVQPIVQAKQAVKDTHLISVKFTHPNPAKAKLVANSLSDELVKQNLGSKVNTNSREQEYLKNNIAELKSQIRRGEEKILDYGKKYELPSEDGSQNTVVERLAGLNRQLLEAENERKHAEVRYKSAQAPGASEALARNEAKEVSATEGKIDDLRQKRAQLLVEVTEKHPEAVAISNQIALLEKALKTQRTRNVSNFKTGLDVAYRRAVARENSVRESYKRQWAKMVNQNGAAINYRIIQQELETNRKLLDEMQRREKESEMLTAQVPNNLSVVEHALTPNEPVKQQRLAYLGLTFLMSLSMGIAVALIGDYFGDTKKEAKKYSSNLNLPATAAIPKLQENVVEEANHITDSTPSVLVEDFPVKTSSILNEDRSMEKREGFSVIEAAFRQHRTVLHLSPDVRDTRMLLVTSSRSTDGQTATSVNIAEYLAQLGASVLLIDANFHNPKIHRIFGFPNEPGLSDLIMDRSNQANISDVIVEVSPNLSLLTSGPMPSICSEYLGSKRMRGMMEAFKTNFDYVIIDSPPVLFFADSSLLARDVDGILLVTEERSDSLEELQQTRRFLERAGAKIVGVVLETEKNQGEAAAVSNGGNNRVL